MGVSVLIASYNCEEYIEECLNCLLNQTYKDVEIIVCDDCSKDNTCNILRKYAENGKIIYLENEINSGAAQCRNNCLAVATKEFVAVQDADDYCTLDRFEKQIRILQKHPEMDFVSTGLQKFYENGEKRDILPKKEFPDKNDFLMTLPFMHATTLFRKDILNKVNGYRVAWETRRGQDYDLFMRIYAAGGKGMNLKEIHYFYRCFLGYTPRNSYKFRVGEFVIRYKGFKALELGVKSIPYIIKPLILGFVPQFLINKKCN
ncbi:MAG: glycosyltransferase [Bacteroides caccae]|nr:glycosyltransferase [Bacteroides caccae]